jgi:hypothetical protein
MRGLPGVEAASLSSSVPFGIEGSIREVKRFDAAVEGNTCWASTVIVGSNYFGTVGLPLLRGRDFTVIEEQGSGAVTSVIVDLPLAKRLWPEGDPLGQLVHLDAESAGGWTGTAEVVGLVAGTRDSLFDKEPGPHLYVPFGGEYHGAMNLYVKLRSGGEGDLEGMAGAIRRELGAADNGMPMLSLKTLSEHRDTSIYMWIARASGYVFATFGVSALLLAVLGVYGVKAYLVSRRTRELGIRVALGATRVDVLWLVLRDGMWMTIVGLAIGLALSVGVSAVLASWVYGVRGIDPAAIVASGACLTSATLLACYLPTRRALRIAPSSALRSE